jgi:hypothetical protein
MLSKSFCFVSILNPIQFDMLNGKYQKYKTFTTVKRIVSLKKFKLDQKKWILNLDVSYHFEVVVESSFDFE